MNPRELVSLTKNFISFSCASRPLSCIAYPLTSFLAGYTFSEDISLASTMGFCSFLAESFSFNRTSWNSFVQKNNLSVSSSFSRDYRHSILIPLTFFTASMYSFAELNYFSPGVSIHSLDKDVFASSFFAYAGYRFAPILPSMKFDPRPYLQRIDSFLGTSFFKVDEKKAYHSSLYYFSSDFLVNYSQELLLSQGAHTVELPSLSSQIQLLAFSLADDNFNSFIQSQHLSFPEAKEFADSRYVHFVRSSSSLSVDKKLYLALYGELEQKDERLCLDEIISELSSASFKPHPVIPWAESLETVPSIIRKVGDDPSRLYQQFLLDVHLEKTFRSHPHLSSSFPFGFQEQNGNASFYEHSYLSETLYTYLQKVSFTEQARVLSSALKLLPEITAAYRTSPVVFEEIDLYQKHVRSPLLTHPVYLSLLERSSELLSGEDLEPIVDYHVKNISYSLYTDHFVSIDHELKGLGHELFDVVNAIELAYPTPALRKKLLEVVLESDTFSTSSPTLYPYALLLRQDAFLRSWSVTGKESVEQKNKLLKNTSPVLLDAFPQYAACLPQLYSLEW